MQHIFCLFTITFTLMVSVQSFAQSSDEGMRTEYREAQETYRADQKDLLDRTPELEHSKEALKAIANVVEAYSALNFKLDRITLQRLNAFVRESNSHGKEAVALANSLKNRKASAKTEVNSDFKKMVKAIIALQQQSATSFEGSIRLLAEYHSEYNKRFQTNSNYHERLLSRFSRKYQEKTTYNRRARILTYERHSDANSLLSTLLPGILENMSQKQYEYFKEQYNSKASVTALPSRNVRVIDRVEPSTEELEAVRIWGDPMSRLEWKTEKLAAQVDPVTFAFIDLARREDRLGLKATVLVEERLDISNMTVKTPVTMRGYTCPVFFD